MAAFLVSRFIQALITLLFLSVLVFLLGRALGNPLDVLLPIDSPEETRAQVSESLGLDRPLPVQYGIYMGKLLRGDLGKSIRTREPVADLLRKRLPASLQLGLAAMIFTVIMAFPLGVVAAVKRGTPIDTQARVLALLGQSVPAFWVGILLIELFAVRLEWLPTSGIGGPSHYVLPAFTMSLFVMAGVTRLLRTSMLEVIDSEFVRFARSKGVSGRSVIWKHALRNALVPVLGFGGVMFAILVTAAIVVEVVFAWPGLGRLAFNAITLRDFPLMQGVVLTTGVIVITVNLLVDILFAFVDPRIRVGKA